MINETKLRKLIKEYCRAELPKAKNEWIDNNIQEFRRILNEVKKTNNYGLLKDGLRRLHSGRNALRFHIRTIADLKNLWENFLKELVENGPEELMKDIDERFERWIKTNGLGKGLISEALTFYYPDHFVPWNNIVDWYFQEFGWGKPTKYSEVLSHLKELREIFEMECDEGDINFVIVDHFGWWFKTKMATKELSRNLASLLQKLKTSYEAEWVSIEDEFREHLQRIKELAKKGGSITENNFKEILNAVNAIHKLLGIEAL